MDSSSQLTTAYMLHYVKFTALSIKKYIYMYAYIEYY